MAALCKTRNAVVVTGRFIHEALSFLVFSILDAVDFLLCFVFKVADFVMEAEWKPCYCFSAKEAITSSGKILVSEQGESKIVCLCSTKLEMEEISDTLYRRPCILSELSKSTVKELKRITVDKTVVQSNRETFRKGASQSVPRFILNSSLVGTIQGKKPAGPSRKLTRSWSECDCQLCTCWAISGEASLFVKVQGPRGKAQEDVLFIHGFISSSTFWTESLFPCFSDAARSAYRLLAVDLLGFGRSPKPTDSFYTLKDHVDMIERSVLEPHRVKSFHIVAHSLGCILALALAVKSPGSVKSLTLLAPPYYPVPKGEQASRYVLSKVAPRKLWPPIAFGSSIACWYEHISRAVRLIFCKNHRSWEFFIKLVTMNRIRTFMCEVFWTHTHTAAWHTFHNIICGTASKLEGYLEAVRDKLKCEVHVIHGEDDELIPVECSLSVKEKVPRAKVKVVKKKDHLTIVVGRSDEFAKELEAIWSSSS